MVNLNRGYRTITKRPFDLQQFNSFGSQCCNRRAENAVQRMAENKRVFCSILMGMVS